MSGLFFTVKLLVFFKCLNAVDDEHILKNNIHSNSSDPSIDSIFKTHNETRYVKKFGWTADPAMQVEYHYTVLLKIDLYEDDKYCNGCLITDKHVLSSARCVTESHTTFFGKLVVRTIPTHWIQIYIGRKITSGGKAFRVINVDIPEGYYDENVWNFEYDMSVVKVSQPLTLSDKILFVKVPMFEMSHMLQDMQLYKTPCILATRSQPDADDVSRLMFVKISFLDLKSCGKLLKGPEINGCLNFCTYNPGVDICVDDQGAALVCEYDPGIKIAWGVVSTSRKCGLNRQFTVYARADALYDFIRVAVSGGPLPIVTGYLSLVLNIFVSVF